jgi:anti-sigma factor RsiW
MSRPDELQLMAYADGELSREEEQAIEARLAADPEARARVAAYRDSAALVRAAFAAGAEEAPPPCLEAALRAAAGSGQVIQLASNPRWRRPVAQLLPLAASLALGVVVGAWWLDRAPTGDALSVALATTPSLAEAAIGDGASITPEATFRIADGRWCRAFTRRGAAAAAEGVACRGSDGAWRVELLAPQALAALPADAYSPAGDEPGPVEAWRATVGAEAPVAPESEAELLAGWR